MLSDVQSPLAVPLPSGSYDPTDLEVAMAAGNAHHQVMMQHAVMSRQSSIASDLTSVRATPSEGYSDREVQSGRHPLRSHGVLLVH